MDQQARIRQMQADLERFRSGGGSAAPAGAPAPAATSAPARQASPIAADLEAFRRGKRDGTVSKTEVPEEPSALAEFARGIFAAPATMLARPVQAAVGVGQDLFGDGYDPEAIEAATAKVPIVGGLIAPTPKSYGDVKKDVGRGIQTVALGTGAPIAGGVAFGVGSSLEQGNDLLSAQTLADAALGGAAGKVAAWVGKPLLNAAGKVVGVITPQTIKDAAAKGAQGIADFAASHKLLGGVAARPAEAIASGFQAVDDKIGQGASKLFRGAKDVAAKEFPGMSPTAHYQRINERDLALPTTVNEPRYAKATKIYNDAKSRKIDLEKVATERGIQHDKLAEGGAYNTLEVVEGLRDDTYRLGRDVIRPALEAVEPGVQRVPVRSVREAMLRRIDELPDSAVTPEDRAWMRKKVEARYADGSAASGRFRDGYSLTNLHDSRIVSQKNGKYKPGGTASDARAAALAREEGRVFAEIFDAAVPESLGIGAARKEFEKNFLLADYLESLHTKKVPEGITKKAVRLFGRAIAATVGGKVGGFPGSILGAQYGDMLFGTFQALPNPVKAAVLSRVKVESPAVFREIQEAIGKEEVARLMRPLLPAPGQTSYREPSRTLFGGPGVAPRESLQEAADVAAANRMSPPGTDARLRGYRGRRAQAEGAQEPYAEGAAIQMGPKGRQGRRIRDVYGDLPTIR